MPSGTPSSQIAVTGRLAQRYRSQRRRWPKPSPSSEKVVSSAKKLPSKCPQRLERFLRCCRFRSLHLAFWLLLSFARDALVHFLAICIPTSVERPDPPRFGATGRECPTSRVGQPPRVRTCHDASWLGNVVTN